MLAVALVLAGYQLYEYRQAISNGWERATGRAELAAQWIEATFMLSDMALESLAELNQSSLLVLRDDAVDPDYERLERVLAERRDRFRFLDELGLFDAGGHVVVTSSAMFPRGYDLGGCPTTASSGSSRRSRSGYRGSTGPPSPMTIASCMFAASPRRAR